MWKGPTNYADIPDQQPRNGTSTRYPENQYHLPARVNPPPTEAAPAADVAEQDQDSGEPETIKITRENSVVFYQGMRIGVPRTLAGRLFYRTISSDELCLWDQATGELVLRIPLPVVAMTQSHKFINSYKIKGVYLAEPTPTWEKRHAEFWERVNNLE